MDLRYPNSFRVADIGDVHFSILVNDRNGGQVPDWEMPSNIVTHVVPGSNPPIVVNDLINHGPSTVTWRLLMASRADHRKLMLMRGQAGALAVVPGLQSHMPTFILPTPSGGTLEVLQDTTLLEVSRIAQERGGFHETDVTFQRVQDARAYITEPTMLMPFNGDLMGRSADGPFEADGSVSWIGGATAWADAARIAANSPVELPEAYVGSIGTLAFRVRFPTLPGGTVMAVRVPAATNQGLTVSRASNGTLRASLASASLTGPPVDTNQWITGFLDWLGGTARLWIGTELADQASYTGSLTPTGGMQLNGSSLISAGPVDVDALGTYGVRFTDAERASMVASDQWAWYGLAVS